MRELKNLLLTARFVGVCAAAVRAEMRKLVLKLKKLEEASLTVPGVVAFFARSAQCTMLRSFSCLPFCMLDHGLCVQHLHCCLCLVSCSFCVGSKGLVDRTPGLDSLQQIVK